MDVFLIVAPPLLWWARRIRRPAAPLVIGFAPFVLWEIFAIVYYGSPWPNTAHAKLGGAIPIADRVEQGVYYLIDSAAMDPLTLMVIATAILAAIVQRRSEERAIAAGIILALVFIVRSGGDFMSGRQLSAPFFTSVLLLMRADWPRQGLVPALGVCTLIVTALGATDPDFLTGRSFRHDHTDRDGIVDERRVYYPYTGLLSDSRSGPLSHPWAQAADAAMLRGETTIIWGANGFFGFKAGRRLDVIDKFALGDAFLARLPARGDWRPGHLERRIPDGYLESRQSHRNVIAEPGLAAFYNHIRTVTEAPLFSRRRFRTIWTLNTGGYDSLLNGTTFGLQRVSAAQMDAPAEEGMAERNTRVIRIHERGLEIALGRVVGRGPVELAVDGNDDYVVVFEHQGRPLGHRFVPHAWSGGDSLLHVAVLEPPSGVREFDSILVRPRAMWGTSSVGRVRVLR
jgi:arabinofuranosyltransferase